MLMIIVFMSRVCRYEVWCKAKWVDNEDCYNVGYSMFVTIGV
jgi:hypothetical protein